MTDQTVGYIASTVPAEIVRSYVGDLFHLAMIKAGDPLQWVAIAELNGLTSPWVDTPQDILIPPVFPNEPVSGILGL